MEEGWPVARGGLLRPRPLHKPEHPHTPHMARDPHTGRGHVTATRHATGRHATGLIGRLRRAPRRILTTIRPCLLPTLAAARPRRTPKPRRDFASSLPCTLCCSTPLPLPRRVLPSPPPLLVWSPSPNPLPLCPSPLPCQCCHVASWCKLLRVPRTSVVNAPERLLSPIQPTQPPSRGGDAGLGGVILLGRSVDSYSHRAPRQNTVSHETYTEALLGR